MSRLRLLEPDDSQPRDERALSGRRTPARPWRRLTSRYWDWQAAVAEHPVFEPLRARPVRRVLVLAFALSAAACLSIFWTRGLWSGWLHYATASVVIVLMAVLILAARGVTALPEHRLDERQLRHHRRLLTRAFWAVLLVVAAISGALPQLIEEGVVRPLDAGQVFALLWGLALLGGMAGLCLEAWEAPSAERE